MSRPGRRPLALALAVVAVGGAALVACGGDADDATDVTLSPSLTVTSADPDVTTSSTSSATTAVPPTNPTADGAPVVLSVQVEAGVCANGAATATVTFDAAPTPPIRVFSVFVDGAEAGASNTAAPITVTGVPCDGDVHSVLLIATGADGLSSTQAVAFRAPRP